MASPCASLTPEAVLQAGGSLGLDALMLVPVRRRRQHRGQQQIGTKPLDSSASASSVIEEEEDERLWQNRMMATTKDFREASFPKMPLHLSDMRRKMFISSASKFLAA